MGDEPSDYVIVHPLLVDNVEVMIMPEVTRVLRVVYQVLSQPNYYLSKSGISSRRLCGPHLMKLKIMGIVNNDVKVCSYISKAEALEIFNSFSALNSQQYLSKIVWSNIIDIENEPVDNPKRQLLHQIIKPELTYFIFENKSIVPWMSFLKILSCDNIESEHLNEEFLATLQNNISFKTLDNQILFDYLTAIKKIHHFGNDLKYVSMEEIMDILIKLGISVTSLPVDDEKNKIRLLPPIYLDPQNNNNPNNNDNQAISSSPLDQYSQSLPPIQSLNNQQHSTNSIIIPSCSIRPTTIMGIPVKCNESMPINSNLVTMSNIPSNQNVPFNTNNNSTNDNERMITTDSPPPSCTVTTYEINGNEVVALPDIHKIIRKSQNMPTGARSAQQRQVNYYLTKMRCKKGRFTFMQLKSIRKHGTPLGNATYCTFVSKEDAKNLFKIYASLNMENPSIFKNVKFNHPISLGPDSCAHSAADQIDYLEKPTTTTKSELIVEKDTTSQSKLLNKDHCSTTKSRLSSTNVEALLYKKYEVLKTKLKEKESQLSIIDKYYKWKIKLYKKKLSLTLQKWKYIVDLLDGINNTSAENNNGILSPNQTQSNDIYSSDDIHPLQ